MYTASVYLILIASPGDTSDEREAADRVITKWNADRSYSSKIVLRALRWESDGGRRLRGQDAQTELNWMVENADVMFAFFSTRPGTPTPRAESGTIEEVDRAIEREIPVHLYFSRKPWPRDTPPEQIAAMNLLQQKYYALGLVGSYTEINELEGHLRSDIEHDIDELSRFASVSGTQVELVRVRISQALPNPRLVLVNEGDRPVNCISTALVDQDGNEVASLIGARNFRLEANGGQKALPIVGMSTNQPAEKLAFQLSWMNGRAVEDSSLPVLPLR